jgi:hypothetical protein
MSRALHLRLLKLERGAGPDEPTVVLPDRPMDENEAADLLGDWGSLVARGDVRRIGLALFVMSAPLTPEDWARRYAP